VKWTVSGRHKTRAFRTKAEAQKFHRRLQRALEDGLDFSSSTGLPVSWTKSLTSFVSCAEEFVAVKWGSLSPRSRESLTNNIAVVVYELLRERGKNKYKRTDDNESFVIKELKARGRKAYRNVPMMQELVDVLQPLSKDLEDGDFLFTSISELTRPIPTGLINDYFKKVVKTDHTPYDLRHTNASILIHSGVNIIEVANRLGNSIPVCQKVYLHLFADAADVDTSKEEEFLAKTRSKPNLKAV
jgi:hypothetical protein